ncbi:hypothetical protein [Nonomuraea roseola]|uniref:Tyr recombinase domain-containing protein n=1 Tax=Nonomuraea roseola TaxID=46179 RepID=A0ABV5QGC9_9ACTN
MVRQWRAELLGNGVSVTMAAKADRLLRAVLMTAAEDDRIIARNPCRIRGADAEHAEERPVLSVTRVFELAQRIGKRPVGSIRGLKKGEGYRVRFWRNGEMRTHPEVFATRAEAERALWRVPETGHADFSQDRRFRAFVLLDTFASLRWGEITALTRSDIDLKVGTVRIKAAYTERSTGEMVLGPPKSKAGRRKYPRRSFRHSPNTWRSTSRTRPVRWPSLEPRAASCGGVASTGHRRGRKQSGPSVSEPGLS